MYSILVIKCPGAGDCIYAHHKKPSVQRIQIASNCRTAGLFIEAVSSDILEKKPFGIYLYSTLPKVSLSRQGRGGGLVVSALAYCSEDPSLNPADY